MFVQDGFLYLIVTKHKLTVWGQNAAGVAPLLDQFVAIAESPSPSFLADLQTPMVGKSAVAVAVLSQGCSSVHVNWAEDLLLVHFVLVWWDGAQQLLAPLYD
jgi:hypothetical protein